MVPRGVREQIEEAVKASSVGTAVRHWRQGRRDGYPPCCIAHFCWDSLMEWPSAAVRWNQIRIEDEPSHVPCGLIHAGGSPLSLPRRLAGIAAFQWAHLKPRRAGRRHTKLRWRGAGASEGAWFSEHYRLVALYDEQLDAELDWS